MILDFLSAFNILTIISIASSMLLSLIGITSIVVFHEFGHFIFCKIFKVYTPTFSIGIGKKIYTKLIGDTEFCISAAPLGGYVEIATEATHGKKGFDSITYLQKVLIMLGGIACNMLFAYIVFAFLFFVGMPDSPFMPYENNLPIVHNITDTSINYGNLETGDIIITCNNQIVNNKAEIIKEVLQKAVISETTQLPVTIKRNGEQKSITLKLRADKKPMLIEQRLEIMLQKKAPLTLQESIYLSIQLTHFYIVTILHSLKNIFSSANSQNLAGPIMTLASSTKIAQKSLKSLLIFLAIISINLGIMNLLPLPIFDGGQFLLFTIETISRKEMSEKTKERIGTFSWFLVLGLIIIFSIKDVYILTSQYFL